MQTTLIRLKLFLSAMLIALQLHGQAFADMGDVKKYKDQRGGIEMLIPEKWQAIEHGDSDAIQIFLASGKGIFDTGIIYNRILDFKKVYPTTESKHVVHVWTNMLDNNCHSYFSCEVQNTFKFNSGKFDGIKREISYISLEGQSAMKAYQLVLYWDNQLVFITMQAPKNEWANEVESFDSAISSLLLK